MARESIEEMGDRGEQQPAVTPDYPDVTEAEFHAATRAGIPVYGMRLLQRVADLEKRLAAVEAEQSQREHPTVEKLRCGGMLVD